MTLSKWIEDLGCDRVSKLLDVHVSTVHQWKIGENFPKPQNMQKIVNISKGQVTYDGIVREYLKLNAAIMTKKIQQSKDKYKI